ncbi:hypothetical protein ABT133_24790 [Streptomyces sp. NPDC001835]|uniref:hypothetical protein n=1 Tax=Streptomyces sp. NPDC001835 TaxID=3154528 RepID=UPI00332B53F6
MDTVDKGGAYVSDEGALVRRSAETSLAYKGLDGVPLWLLFGIAIVAFIVFGVVQARKKK